MTVEELRERRKTRPRSITRRRLYLDLSSENSSDAEASKRYSIDEKERIKINLLQSGFTEDFINKYFQFRKIEPLLDNGNLKKNLRSPMGDISTTDIQQNFKKDFESNDCLKKERSIASNKHKIIAPSIFSDQGQKTSNIVPKKFLEKTLSPRENIILGIAFMAISAPLACAKIIIPAILEKKAMPVFSVHNILFARRESIFSWTIIVIGSIIIGGVAGFFIKPTLSKKATRRDLAEILLIFSSVTSIISIVVCYFTIKEEYEQLSLSYFWGGKSSSLLPAMIATTAIAILSPAIIAMSVALLVCGSMAKSELAQENESSAAISKLESVSSSNFVAMEDSTNNGASKGT